MNKLMTALAEGMPRAQEYSKICALYVKWYGYGVVEWTEIP